MFGNLIKQWCEKLGYNCSESGDNFANGQSFFFRFPDNLFIDGETPDSLLRTWRYDALNTKHKCTATSVRSNYLIVFKIVYAALGRNTYSLLCYILRNSQAHKTNIRLYISIANERHSLFPVLKTTTTKRHDANSKDRIILLSPVTIIQLELSCQKESSQELLLCIKITHGDTSENTRIFTSS